MKKLYKYIVFIFFLFTTIDMIAQDFLVKGVVREKEGRQVTVPGVSVFVKDQKTKKVLRGTTSNLDGEFSVRVPANAQLEFSCIGYEPVVRRITKNEDNLRIYMVESVNMIDETVIVGYENKRKTSVTASTVVVDSKDLAMTPVANPMELLQGRVAGFDLQMNNGTPGSIGQMNIRGVSSLNVSGDGENAQLLSGTPLFVIDGIPQEDVGDYDSQGLLNNSGVSPLSMLPYEDIDNIQVLKDAAATSLYGSKGAYGVVLIQTKRGNSPKPRLVYSGNFKVNTPPSLRDVAIGNAERRARIMQILQNDTSIYHGLNAIHGLPALSDSLNPYYNNNTDWQGNFYRRTYNQTHNVSFSGGDKAFNYKINGNYYTEKGIIQNTDFNRYGITMNMGYAPNDKFDLDVKVSATFAINSTGSGDNFSQKGVASGSNASSLLPPPSLYTASNEALSIFKVDDDKTSSVYDASLNVGYKLPWNLQWRATVGYKYTRDEQETFTPAILSQVDGNPNMAIWYNASNRSHSIYGRTTLSGNVDVGLLTLGLTLGTELSLYKKGGNEVSLKGMSSDYIWGPIGYAPKLTNGTAYSSTNNNTLSFMINPSIGWKGNDKYVLTPTIRPEVNSSYGAKIKWTINPGLGFKWNFTAENFMEKWRERFLSSGAIRATWGRSVRYSASRYDIWGVYNLLEDTYNGSSITPIDFGNLPNQDLKPVTTTQWNLGLDLNFWNGKLMFTADAYYKQTDNDLRETALANHNGFDKIKSTETSLVNYGLELQVGGRPLSSQSDWNLYCNFTLAFNKDVITKLPNDLRQIIASDYTYVNKLGSNTFGNYLYVYKGVYATDEDVPVNPATGKRLRVGGNTSEEAYFRAGDPIWVDVNGDYVIDEKDRVIVGNSRPRVTGGFSLNLRYKAFSINTNTSFTLRRDIINKALADRFASYGNPLTKSLEKEGAMVPIDAYNFWTPDNRYGAEYPNPYDYTRSNIIKPYRAEQTLFMEDGSYFKINTISVAYDVHKSILKWFGIGSMTLNASMNNVWTFSNYSGINPENVTSLGYDNSGGYPNARSYTVGIIIRL